MNLEATQTFTPTHVLWGSGLGQGGQGVGGGSSRGSGTPGAGGPHGGDIRAPADVWVRHGRRAFWELGGAWLVKGELIPKQRAL